MIKYACLQPARHIGGVQSVSSLWFLLPVSGNIHQEPVHVALIGDIHDQGRFRGALPLPQNFLGKILLLQN